MMGHYSYGLLALSLCTGALNAFAGCELGQRARAVAPTRSNLWYLGGAFAIGTGLWAQHFMQIVAAGMSLAGSYRLSCGVAAYLTAVIIGGVTLRSLAERLSAFDMLKIAMLGGIGLGAMHLLSIESLQIGSIAHLDFGTGAASLLLGIGSVWVGLWIAANVEVRNDWRSTIKKLGAATAFATALVTTHHLNIVATHVGENPSTQLPLAGERWIVALLVFICALDFIFILVIAALDRRLWTEVEHAHTRLHADKIELQHRVAERTQSLVREESHLRAILASALDCIITTAPDGMILQFNPAAERTFGYRREEVIGRRAVDLIVPQTPPTNADHVAGETALTTMLSMLGQRRETTLRRKDHTLFPAEFSVSQIVLGDEQFFNIFVRDITARRAAEDALKAAKNTAEAESDAKTTFLATMSHEIRTPMNAMLGLLELHAYSRLDDEQRESVRLMRQSSKSLLRLIDDILDFSKIEAGKLEIHREPTLLHDVISDVCATFSAVAREKGIALEHRIADSLPLRVMTDGLRLRQILNNLLSNAIKFTQRGAVSVWAAPAYDSDAPHTIEFEIADSGIGMSKAVLARCGEPFQQADAGMARRYGGSGLGLAICRRLCNLMQGTMEIASEPGVGTRIKVRLPLPALSQAEADYAPDVTQGLILSIPSKAPSIEAAAANKQLIMVVDDHPTNRRLLVQQLEWLGYACEAYSNGHSALSRYKERLAAGTPYAMTITDCQMPEMDGYDLAREIRNSEMDTVHRTVLIAFTANTLRSISELCHSCGFDDLLTKPANLATLKLRLDRWLPLPQSHALLPGATGESVSLFGHLSDPGLQDEFRQAHEEDLALLQAGQNSGDPELIGRAAHRIKGAARMIGAKALGEAASGLLRVSRSEDWRQIREMTGLVKQATRELFEEFSRNPRRVS